MAGRKGVAEWEADNLRGIQGDLQHLENAIATGPATDASREPTKDTVMIGGRIHQVDNGLTLHQVVVATCVGNLLTRLRFLEPGGDEAVRFGRCLVEIEEQGIVALDNPSVRLHAEAKLDALRYEALRMMGPLRWRRYEREAAARR